MNKIIYFMVVAVMLSGVSFNALATQKTVSGNNIKSSLVVNGDSVKFELQSLIDSVKQSFDKSSLDDTLFSADYEKYRDSLRVVESNHAREIHDKMLFREQFLLPVIICSVLFLSVVMIIVFCLYFNHKKRKARYDLIQSAIENNYQIPEYLMESSKKNSSFSQGECNESDKEINWDELRNAGILFAIGFVAWISFGWDTFMGQICLVPTFIGVVKAIVFYLENMRKPRRRTPQPPEIPGEEPNDTQF